MLFMGDDWAEDHHDVALVDEEGRLLAQRRLPEGVQGIEGLHGLVADHLDEQDGPDQVMVGIETDRGPWVAALLAAGYTVFAVNPLQAARYRDRHGTSGAKSDKGDALVLASWCAPTVPSTVRSPETVMPPRRSKSWHALISH